jgi:hypothetical protein
MDGTTLRPARIFGGCLRDFTIENDDPAGTCIQLEGVMGFTIEDVVLKGGNVFQLVIGAKKALHKQRH